MFIFLIFFFSPPPLLQRYAGSKEKLNVAELQRFLHDEQGEKDIDAAALAKLCPMECAEFLEFLHGPANSVLDPKKAAKSHGNLMMSSE